VVDDIKFKQVGKYTYPEERLSGMLRLNIETQVKKKYDPMVVDADIKRLYKMGYFSDVTAEKIVNSDGGITVTFVIVPKARVSHIKFDGNKKFTSLELQEQISLPVDMPLNEASLQESLKKLRDYYHGKGYNDALVSTELKQNKDETLTVLFHIEENLRMLVKRVNFVGNKAIPTPTLQGAIANRSSIFSGWAFTKTGLLQRREFRNDKLRIRELYWNKGFLDLKIKSLKVDEDPKDPEYVTLTFTLFEGRPYKVGHVYVSGGNSIPTEELEKLITLKSGDMYDNRLEKRNKKVILDKYYEKGYSNAVCKIVRIPDFQTHTVDISFRITEGQQYNIKYINISGNKITKDKVIRRELSFKPGRPVNPEEIEANKSRLMGMGYFEKVNIVQVASADPTKKDLNVTVKEKNTGRVSIGAGISDFDGAMGMLEVSEKNFDITNPKKYFRGGGQRFRARGILGVDMYGFDIDFTEPWLMDRPLALNMSAYLHQRIYDDWDEARGGFKLSLSHPVFDDFTTVIVGYNLERVKIDEMSDSSPQSLKDEEGSDWISKVSLGLHRSTLDSFTNPTEGYEANIDYDLIAKALGSSEDYYRLSLKYSHYWNFLDKAFILHVGGKVGFQDTFGGSSGEKVPLYDRYFLGGGNSVRGFEYRSMAPIDKATEDPLGGESMYIGTIELTHPIFKFIRGAIFVDAGNSVNGTGFKDLSDINVGAGYGLRINIPGQNVPIKLDLAYPIVNNVDGTSDKLRLHFSMGFSW
jgi:outer membrane protein insertion porin family